MFYTGMMQDFEIVSGELLQPPALLTHRLRRSFQPFQCRMVCPYDERSPQQILPEMFDEKDHGQQFLPRRTVVGFGSTIKSATVRNDPLLTVLHPGQHGADGTLRRVGIKSEHAFVSRQGYDRCGGELFFENPGCLQVLEILDILEKPSNSRVSWNSWKTLDLCEKSWKNNITVDICRYLSIFVDTLTIWVDRIFGISGSSDPVQKMSAEIKVCKEVDK